VVVVAVAAVGGAAPMTVYLLAAVAAVDGPAVVGVV
jgi:hypothetical protein